MKKDLDHLPERKQDELALIQRIIFEEFEAGLAQIRPRGGKQTGGRILKIILFGSHARGDWVEDRGSGYFSDFDILIIVNKDYVVEALSLFHAADRSIEQNTQIGTPTNLIVHTLGEVNSALGRGDYFFADIRKEGILLYERSRNDRLRAPQPLTPEEAYKVAKEHYEYWMPSAERFFEHYKLDIEKGWLNEAAFHLHQAAERAYRGLLLVLTNYAPNTHNLNTFRSMTEHRDIRLRNIWPEDTKQSRRRYELLKRAYIDARYSKHYKITEEELDYLAGRVEVLHGAVRVICGERLSCINKGHPY